MTRAEALALVVAPMPPGYARQLIRDALKGWPAGDVAAWHRLKDNERKQEKREAKKAARDIGVRSAVEQQTGQVPVGAEGENRTSSGLQDNDKPDPSPSPQVSPLDSPSSPAPTPALSPARIREDADILKFVPATLRTPEILAEIPAWIAHCREHALARGKAFTTFTARSQFGDLERMGPEKALRAIRSSGAKGSASIIDPDEKRFGGTNGQDGPNGTKPRAPGPCRQHRRARLHPLVQGQLSRRPHHRRNRPLHRQLPRRIPLRKSMSTRPNHEHRVEAPSLRAALPHDLEAEQGLLGSMLLAPAEVIDAAARRIGANEFYHPPHQTIFALLVEMWSRQVPADIVTLTQALRDRKQLEAVGGPPYITSLIDLTPTAANANYYLDLVKEMHVRRAIYLKASAVAAASLQHGANPNDLLEQMQLLLTDLARQASTGSDVVTMKQTVPDAIDRIIERQEGKGKLRGIPSGLGLLDRLTNGWQPGQMIVVSAREKEGKSSLARQFVLESCGSARCPTNSPPRQTIAPAR